MVFNAVRVFCGVLFLSSLVACGGGGGDAGDVEGFSVFPEEYKLTIGKDTSCGEAASVPPVIVTINGGQPPFRIVNSREGALVVDKTSATGKDPVFKVSVNASTVVCPNPGVITVLDAFSNVASFSYFIEREESDE